MPESLIGHAPETFENGLAANAVSSNIWHTALGVAGLAFGLLVGYWGIKMVVTGRSPFAKSHAF